jgi:hypothetical protein
MKKLFSLHSFLWLAPAFSQTLSLVQSGYAGDASGCNGSSSCTISTTVGVNKLAQAFGANHIITLFIDGEGTSNFPVPGTPSCSSACGTWTHISGGNVVSASGSNTTSGNYCAVQDLNSTGHHFFSDCWVVLTSSSGATGVTVSFTDPGGGSDITNMDLFVAEYSCSSTCSPSVDAQAAFVYPGNGVAAACTSCTGPSMTLSGTNDLVLQTAIFEENCNTGCNVTNYTLRSWDTSSQNATADALDRSSATQAVWPQTPKGGGIFAAFAINLNSQSTTRGCTISPTSLNAYTAGQMASQQFTASNCASSAFTISSGSLAGSGLSLSTSGMLTGGAEAGTFQFTLSYGPATDSISLTVNAAASITTSLLSAGQVNVAYSQGLSTIGGTGAIACALTAGSLPVGLTLSGCTISGTPNTANTYHFSVTPVDANGVSGGARPLSITINPASSGLAAVGSLAQIASGGGWNTEFDYVNLAPTQAQSFTNFFDTNGNQLLLPLMFPQTGLAGAPAPSINASIDPYSVFIMDSTGLANVSALTGWAQLESDGNVSGFGIFSNSSQGWNAVVPLETRNASSYILAFDNTGQLATGVAIANVNAQAADVSVIIRDDTGEKIGTATISLVAQGHTSFMLNQINSTTAGKRGSVEFDTLPGGQISVVGLRANRGALTTLPLLANVGTNGGAIAHLTFNGGFTTTFYLVNTGAAASFSLSFFDEGGNTQEVPLLRPQSGTTTTTSILTQTMAAGAILEIETEANDALPLVQGSAQLTTTGNITGFEVYRWTTFDQEASVPIETRTPNSFVLIFDNTNGLTTGLALANVDDQPATVTVNLRDDTGNMLQSGAITLAARGHVSFVLPDVYALATGKRGTVEFVTPAGGRISVIGVRATPGGTLTTIPVFAN